MRIFLKNIILTLVLLMGVSSYTWSQIDSSKVEIDVLSDSTYTLAMKYNILSATSLDEKHATWAIYRGNSTNKYFWLGTGSLAIAAGVYTLAAWSDPVVYIESHKHYDRDYYNKAIMKRNIKIIGGTAFAGLAVYFYSKINRKHRVKWIIGPDGVKYNF